MSRVTHTGGREATHAVVPGTGILSIGNPRTEIASGYEWTPLAAVARLESGHTPSRQHPEYWNGSIPWIGIRDATENDGQILQETKQHITNEGVENSSTRLLPTNTVCLSRTASVGYVLQMGQPMCTSQDFVNWVCTNRLNPAYLRYALVVEAPSIRRWATGSTHQTLYYPEAKALHLNMPGRSIQDAVVNILGALDDKIAANRRIVTAADELIAIYVHDRLTERAHLFESLTFTFGSAFQGASFTDAGEGRPLLRIRDLKTGTCQVWTTETRADETTIQPGDIVVGMDAEFRPTRWKGSPSLLNQRVAKAASKVYGPALTREICKKPLLNIENAKSATTVIHLNKRDLVESECLVPPTRQIEQIRAMVDPLFARASRAELENTMLARTRDELLPLLMSGKITVKDAERTVEEVA